MLDISKPEIYFETMKKSATFSPRCPYSGMTNDDMALAGGMIWAVP